MLLHNRYEYDPRINWLADGSSSKVYKATDTHNQQAVVLKFYHTLGNLTPAQFKDNMARTMALHHPNLVQLHDYFEIENINPFGQLDYIRIGVWEFVAHTPTTDTESILRQSLDALQYLQQNNTTHGSITPENIFTTASGQVKLNNAGAFVQDIDTTATDLRQLGEALHYSLSGGQALSFDDTNALKLALPDDTREVYSIIIQKTAHDDANIGDITHLLDTYDRDKRFDKVLPLTEAQFESRYELLDMLDSNDEHSTYQANDNLLATAVTLAIYHAHPSAEYYNKLNKATLAHLFKVQFGEKLSLVGVMPTAEETTNPVAIAEPAMGDTAIIAAAATVAAVETLTATDSNETADSENALPTDDMPTAATSTETTTTTTTVTTTTTDDEDAGEDTDSSLDEENLQEPDGDDDDETSNNEDENEWDDEDEDELADNEDNDFIAAADEGDSDDEDEEDSDDEDEEDSDDEDEGDSDDEDEGDSDDEDEGDSDDEDEDDSDDEDEDDSDDEDEDDSDDEDEDDSDDEDEGDSDDEDEGDSDDEDEDDSDDEDEDDSDDEDEPLNLVVPDDDDDEELKPTEIINSEAMQQVLKDMERLLKNDD